MSKVERYWANGDGYLFVCGRDWVPKDDEFVLWPDFKRVQDERDALQQRLNEADERNDELSGMLQHLVDNPYRFTDAYREHIAAALNGRSTADQQIDELTQRKAEPVEWGAPKTVRQLIRQLETLDQDLRPLSMLRVPGKVFEDGKDRTRAVHLSFSHERVEGQWLAPFKGDGEKVVAFWCRMERPEPQHNFAMIGIERMPPMEYDEP